tara:strand:- start:547 stop:867 length:321 start_codon:yes stop_codon:yes gene_type:complete
MLFDARLTKTRHTSLAYGAPRPPFALTCPASAITFLKLPPTAAVLLRPSQPDRPRMRPRCRATAQDAILIHPGWVLEVVRAAYVLSGAAMRECRVGMLPTPLQAHS